MTPRIRSQAINKHNPLRLETNDGHTCWMHVSLEQWEYYCFGVYRHNFGTATMMPRDINAMPSLSGKVKQGYMHQVSMPIQRASALFSPTVLQLYLFKKCRNDIFQRF